MGYSNFDLDFIKPGKNDLPGPSHALVHVKSSHSFRKSELRYVTPDCVSIREFEYEINRLHKELDQILKRAEKRFASP